MLPKVRYDMTGRRLIVIPARGGSKGIPRKNLRLLGGQPLITRVIRAALNATSTDLIVTTEDEEIAAVAIQHGAMVIQRPHHLSEDDVALDEVVVHAVQAMEERMSATFEHILTIQPTSPFLQPETIDRAFGILESHDCVITVTDDRHLRWNGTLEAPSPAYEARVNRQWLPPAWVETGGIIGCRRDRIETGTRIGGRIGLLELSSTEGLDIDTHVDWALAEALLSTPKVAFRILGTPELGLGHAYRALTLADHLASRPVFLIEPESSLAAHLVRSRHHEVVEVEDLSAIVRVIEDREVDVIVNDVLDTSFEDVEFLRSTNRVVVNFEDLGPGSTCADLTINALYEHEEPLPNQRYGWQWVCLRDEFLRPSEGVPREMDVLITFGGTDPRDLTTETLAVLSDLPESERQHLRLSVILGPGNPRTEAILGYIADIEDRFQHLEVHTSVPRMSHHMRRARLGITSNGRTTYEFAACNTPFIAISQNAREDLHTFSSICEGAVSLPFSEGFPGKAFHAALERMLLGSEATRVLKASMLHLEAYDLESGTNRVINEITRLHRVRAGGTR